jgi:hypothetical protein
MAWRWRIAGEHDWEVARAYQRAVGVVGEAAKSLPRADVEESIKALLDRDRYGMRAGLASVLKAISNAGAASEASVFRQ